MRPDPLLTVVLFLAALEFALFGAFVATTIYC